MPFSVIIFQVIIILLVPLLSIANLQMMDRLKEVMLPEKKKLYFQSAINQIVLTIVALWAANASEIQISYIGNITTLGIIGAVVFLGIAFTVGYLATTRPDADTLNPGLELLKPNTISEKWSWVAVNMVAAVCEEIIFRGVLFQLFLRTTHNVWAAGIMSAITFGFSHSVQGLAGIIITAVFGFGLQHLVQLNNGLLVAMVVHFIYNMGTTFWLMQKNHKTE